MRAEALLLAVPSVLLVATLGAVPLARRFGVGAGYPLAVLTAGAGVLLLTLLGDALEDPITVAGEWLPTLGAQWSLRLDALGLVFALVVTFVGAVVLAYSPRYLHGGETDPSRYYGALAGFAAAMTLLVLAGDALVLYVGWEITTLASYLLIASVRAGRRAATRALLITFVGGLALLAAILLAGAWLNTVALTELTDPARWVGAPLMPFLVLLVVAAAVKSVQVPFHVWLPSAMVAPTPVSAYLHAAAMVTAGLYLLLRFAEPIGTRPAVGAAVAALGAVTALFAAAAAVRRRDMKELLAFSTISQLGFMMALVGIGTEKAITGAVVYFLAHATYKSALFLCAGAYDHAVGTRALPELAGSARRLPLTTGAMVLACLSMAGLPPALGYVGKEAALKGVLHPPDALRFAVLVCIVVAQALTVAYSVRLAAAPFRHGARARPDERRPSEVPEWPMALWPAVLSVATVWLGTVTAAFTPLRLTPLTDAATEVAVGAAPGTSLALWHGVTPAFLVSLGIFGAGGVLFVLWRIRGWWRLLPDEVGSRAVDAFGGLLRSCGRPVERVLVSPVPATHLTIVFLVSSVVVWVALLAFSAAVGPEGEAAPRWVVSVLIAAAAVAVAVTQNWLTAFATLAAVGFLVSAWYVLLGAPQLAAVQLVVDGLTVILALFVLRHLPRRYVDVRWPRRVWAAGVALAGGVTFAGLSLFQRNASLPPASESYLAEARSSSTGNVVTEILSHYRALDTLGETAVIAVAAIGVAAVLRMRREGS
ncbi:hydrogen gas-evolving membrane-bound hydrogenase subunit E [Actinopolyspora halophila]|uniref:hydrogen gas-evolving membrane-bound hydrogenase subunit E n=1 Tax=Actinopolyspora halophila TaxID=1850 RepID=UPI0003AA5AC1|nr:hydrogen gas-evolving membrane-bound hydrogenase subunit E [Actinopolyspora halophila]